ncbi:MAG: biopolymer transporter ExbD [Candidatus Eremiobacteraeota bacterium]|nr:biopolymer transporter ExbD [Candidatus Eremiobacteraeota bacterium]
MTQARASTPSEIMAEINITPFTDVLLVLLIIFMILAAISTPPGFQKQVARAPQPRLNDPGPAFPIVVAVTAGDDITLDGHAVPFEQLYKMMAGAVSRHAQRRQSTYIELIADAQASYNTIIKILDAARQAGDENVGFVVR